MTSTSSTYSFSINIPVRTPSYERTSLGLCRSLSSKEFAPKLLPSPAVWFLVVTLPLPTVETSWMTHDL